MFICEVDRVLTITEDFLALCNMQGHTTGKDVLAEIQKVVEQKNLDLSKICFVATNGVCAMIGRANGLVSLLMKVLKKDRINPPLLQFHCILHQQNLAAKAMKPNHVVNVIKDVVIYLQQKGLRHRQFCQFLNDSKPELKDVPYFAQVRWLSTRKMLLQAFNL